MDPDFLLGVVLADIKAMQQQQAELHLAYNPQPCPGANCSVCAMQFKAKPARMTWKALDHCVKNGVGQWDKEPMHALDAVRYRFRFRWPATSKGGKPTVQVLTWEVVVISHELMNAGSATLDAVMHELNAAIYKTHGNWPSEIRLLINEAVLTEKMTKLQTEWNKHTAVVGWTAQSEVIQKEIEQLKLELDGVKQDLHEGFVGTAGPSGIPVSGEVSDEVSGAQVVRDLETLLPGLREIVKCPVVNTEPILRGSPECAVGCLCGVGDDELMSTPRCSEVGPLRGLIVHLNDGHRWTREQVADWLDTLDVDLQFPVDGAPRLPAFDPSRGDLFVVAPNLRAAQVKMRDAGVPKDQWRYVNTVNDLRGWREPQHVVIDIPGSRTKSWPQRRQMLLETLRQMDGVLVTLD